MNDDIEDRLRRTYGAVADRTDVAASSEGLTVESGSAALGPSRRRTSLALGTAAAALMVLVVGGLVAISGSRSEAPADTTGGHVLPTWVATSISPVESSARLPLVSITSDADADVITYGSDALDLWIRVDRSTPDTFSGRPVEVRNDQPATIDGTEDAGRLRWEAPDGPTITVEWIGDVFDGVDSIAAMVDGLVLVDEATWNSAIEFGGFTNSEQLMKRRVGPIDVFMEGDLQSGLWFMTGNVGNTRFPLLSSGEAECLALGNADNEIWIIVSRFSAGTATTTWPDGSTEKSELAPFVPGSFFGVAVVQSEPSDVANDPDVVCEEAS